MFRYYADIAQYEMFADYLLREKPYLDPTVTYQSLCSFLGLPSRKLDRTLMAELGVSGQEIMEIFRKGDVKNLLLLQF